MSPVFTRFAFFSALIACWGEMASLSATDDDDLDAMDIEGLLNEKIIPANVLGTHTHMSGEWMVGYTFMNMPMETMGDGTQKLSTADVLQNFMATPTSMDMQMHMLHVMYAPTDNLTLIGMVNYYDKSMDHVTRSGVEFTTRSKGLGDIEFGGLYHIYRKGFDKQRVIVKATVSLPTGSINETDFLANPAMGERILPYPMQLGSGTVDLHPSIKYIQRQSNSAWGADLDFTIRLGQNSREYTLGNKTRAALWYRYQLNDWFAPFFEIDAKHIGKIKGRDPDLNPMMVPTADPDNQGGEIIALQVGFNIFFQNKMMDGQRLAFEFKKPLYQNLNGPQLRTKWHLRGGWQWVF